MVNYDALCAFDPRIAEDKLEPLLARFEKKITDNEGEIINIEKWGLKRLPFTFSKHKDIKEANFILIKFKGGGNAVNALRDMFRIQEEIVRHVITREKEAPKTEEITLPAAPIGVPVSPAEETLGKS